MITQAKLAELAGVSQMTVHKALHGHPKVSATTRDAIIQLAKEQGYKFNTAAATMRTGKTGCVSLVLSQIEHRSQINSELIYGIQEQLSRHGLRMNIACLSDDTIDTLKEDPTPIKNWHSDGLIINYNSQVPDALVSLVEAEHLPYVWVNTKLPNNSVHPDDTAGAYDATMALIARGHRSIAYADCTYRTHYSSVDREAGYVKAMSQANLTTHRIGEPSWRGNKHLVDNFRQALRQHPKPTAVIAYSILEATNIAHACALEGIELGQELSMFYFSISAESPFGQTFGTQHIPARQIGLTAVDMLLTRMDQPHINIQSKAAPYHFSLGDTVADAPHA